MPSRKTTARQDHGETVRCVANEIAEAADFTVGDVDFQTSETDRSDALTPVVEHGGTDADDALGILFVVNAEADQSDAFELVQELGHRRDGVRGVRVETNFINDLSNVLFVEL